MGSIDEFFGVSGAVPQEIVLCRCDCHALLKVMSLPAGSRIVCPSCRREFAKPGSGKNTENFAGALLLMLAVAKVFATRANAPPSSVCDHCLTPTPKEDGYLATRELMLLGNLEEVLRHRPRPCPQLPNGLSDDAVRVFRKLVEADPTPWLLCQGCASIIFPSALATILSVRENAELWDAKQLPSAVYLDAYSSRLPGETPANRES